MRIPGKSLYVPRIDRSVPNHMDLLRVHDENDLQSLASGTWGIKEPSEQYNGAARSNGELLPRVIHGGSLQLLNSESSLERWM